MINVTNLYTRVARRNYRIRGCRDRRIGLVLPCILLTPLPASVLSPLHSARARNAAYETAKQREQRVIGSCAYQRARHKLAQ